MTILDKIVAYKHQEVENAKKETTVAELEASPLFNRKPYSLKAFLQNQAKTGIIAEFKRKSPSKGIINDKANVAEVVSAYEKAGASAVSVLTDQMFFGGNLSDLQTARKALKIPLLRKDFIIDQYQIIEAKAYGADVILLIASILTKEEIKNFASLARSLGLSILFEVHQAKELEKLNDDIDIVGVNNRNLKTFEVSIHNSIALAKQIPGRCVKVSESGISDTEKIITLKKHGFQGFLIGENFMKTDNPGQAAFDFMKTLKNE